MPEGTIVATVFATDQDVSKSAGITVTSTRSGGGGSSGSGSSSAVTDTVIPDSITSNYLAYFIVDGNEKGHFKVRRPLLSPKNIFHLIYKIHAYMFICTYITYCYYSSVEKYYYRSQAKRKWINVNIKNIKSFLKMKIMYNCLL